MQVGVLLIGSLLWDNRPHRESWRRDHLRLDDKIAVKVPIRYGRRSMSRGNTFTMVFRNDESFGQAVLVPCRSSVTDIGSLIVEARALWKAERASARQGEVGASWGCVGILLRDKNPNLEEGWGRYFQEQATQSIDPVNGKGILNIPWPTDLDDTPVADVDVILATATEREEIPPTPTEIADAWINQNEGHEHYFFENVRHGIRTPEDLDIWRRIEERSPEWLNNPNYAETVSLLRKEVSLLGKETV